MPLAKSKSTVFGLPLKVRRGVDHLRSCREESPRQERPGALLEPPPPQHSSGAKDSRSRRHRRRGAWCRLRTPHRLRCIAARSRACRRRFDSSSLEFRRRRNTLPGQRTLPPAAIEGEERGVGKNASPPPLHRGEKPGVPGSHRLVLPGVLLAGGGATRFRVKNSHPSPTLRSSLGAIAVEGAAQSYRTSILAAPDFIQYASSPALPSST